MAAKKYEVVSALGAVYARTDRVGYANRVAIRLGQSHPEHAPFSVVLTDYKPSPALRDPVGGAL